MGPTARELELLGHYEAGLTNAQIAKRMGIGEASVRRILHLMSDSPNGDLRREALIAQGSANLAAAILETGRLHQ